MSTDKYISPAGNVIDRRIFIKQLSAAGVMAALGGGAHAAPAADIKRKRYAIVGAGARSAFYQRAIQTAYKDHAALVAVCDTNPGRMEVARAYSRRVGMPPPPAYLPEDFEKLIGETKPGHVIITSTDSTHDDYIIRTMNAGCDVISEKPMTTTAEKCQNILDAKKRTGRECRVTFNVRYMPASTQLKDILMSGEIGDILSADLNWMLDTRHGADYFRRWHSRKSLSGGLMLTKATHHFDLVNWLLGANPATVFAVGKREYYTPQTARRMGLGGNQKRCLSCPEKKQCAFYLDLNKSPTLKKLYLDNEKYDGYMRDQCVFRYDIDIEDTMSLTVRYENNTTLTYSLNAFCASEGYRLVLNGTKGRLEHLAGQPQPGAPARTIITPLRGKPREVEVWKGAGSHGGGDKAMLDELFLPGRREDKYMRYADERAAAMSLLIGAAANICFKTGLPVDIKNIIHDLRPPDFAPMPSRADPIAMPAQPL